MQGCIFVIFDDFIVFYKSFAATCPPAGFFLSKKKEVPRLFEYVLSRLGPFSSIWGSQEASYIDSLIFIVAFKPGREGDTLNNFGKAGRHLA